MIFRKGGEFSDIRKEHGKLSAFTAIGWQFAGAQHFLDDRRRNILLKGLAYAGLFFLHAHNLVECVGDKSQGNGQQQLNEIYNPAGLRKEQKTADNEQENQQSDHAEGFKGSKREGDKAGEKR